MLLDPFIERKREQQAYEKIIAEKSPWVMVITGVGGCGKTELLKCWEKQTTSISSDIFCSRLYLSRQIDPLTVLDQLANLVKQKCFQPQFYTFKNALAEYRNKLIVDIRELNQTITAKGGGIVNSVGQSVTLKEALEENKHHVWELVAEVFYNMMDTFDLKQLVIMLDSCEWAIEPDNEIAGRWIFNELLPNLHTRMQDRGRQCSIVIASRMKPPLDEIDNSDVNYLTIQNLTHTEVDHYLKQKGIQDTELRKRIYEMTYGHAHCVKIISDIWLEQGQELLTIEELQEKFYDKALEKFVKEDVLERLKSPFRELTRYGALLRGFNLPLLQAVFQELPKLTIDNFNHLIRYPYVKPPVNQYYAFLELLRELQSQEILVQEPDKWKCYHQYALDYFTHESVTHESVRSIEWYYHALACNEEEARQNAFEKGELEVLRKASLDKTLKLKAGSYE